MACVIGYANQTDISTLSGGSWNASYPLTNLQNRYLSQKARSNNALASSTVINVDLGQVQRIGVIALVSHNLSATATVRIQASSSSTMSPLVYDSNSVTIYLHTDYATSFAATEARYWRISISDTSNVNGYVEIGRLFLGWKFAPSNNIDWSPSISIDSKTAVAESLGGPEYFETRPNRRLWQGKWSWLNDYEAYRVFHTMQRQTDISGEVYLIEDDTDTTFRDLRWFLGRFRSLSPIEWPYLNQHSAGVEIGEIL